MHVQRSCRVQMNQGMNNLIMNLRMGPHINNSCGHACDVGLWSWWIE